MGKLIYQRFLKKRKGYLFLLVLTIGVGVGLNGLPPFVFGRIIDIITVKARKQFWGWLVAYIVILFCVQLLSVLETVLGQWLVSTIENDVKGSLMKRIIYMKSGRIDGYNRGELLNRLEFDAETIVNYYIDLVSSVLMIAVNFTISLYFILRISVKLSAAAILFFPFLYLVNFAFRKKVRRVDTELKKTNDEYYSFVNGIFDSMNPIKAFSVQPELLTRFTQFLGRKLNIEMKNVRLVSGVAVLRAFLTNALDIVLLTAAGMFIMAGELTVGSMVAFNSYQSKLFEAVSKILELNLNRQGVLISYERIEEVQKEMMETEQDGTIELCEPIRNIQFRNVAFSYSSMTGTDLNQSGTACAARCPAGCDENAVLQGLNLHIAGPGLYSVVGENGCGKTTVLKLLERFYDAASGEILLNGIDISQYRILSFRKQMSYMAKEPFFVADTVYNNIRLGNQDATEEKIEDMCRETGIHKDIMEMERQYRTVIQEGGRNLSSGQKQKIGLARVLLRRTPVYLLDEVTSDLDGAAEKKVCSLMEHMAAEAIVINVSHKEECLRRSKKIMVMDHGKIIAEGSHDMLMESCPLYRRLYDAKE